MDVDGVVQANTQANTQDNTQAGECVDGAIDSARVKRIVDFCKQPKSRRQIQEYVKIKSVRDFNKRILEPLLTSGVLKRTIPDKPTSPKQKYFSLPTN